MSVPDDSLGVKVPWGTLRVSGARRRQGLSERREETDSITGALESSVVRL